jgi:hypothetical protein
VPVQAGTLPGAPAAVTPARLQIDRLRLTARVDSAEQGKGAFFRLRELIPGDAVTITGGDGSRHVFTVVARESYAKTTVPLERYFARDGAPRLTLITCGGPFDARTRHYRDNVVITAQPAAR